MRPMPARPMRRAMELQPDIILLDNHLAGVNGVDALPALREAAPGARILMLTVSEDEDDLAAALRVAPSAIS
jgi:two-component system nitrate/nitrite response regulator NarL